MHPKLSSVIKDKDVIAALIEEIESKRRLIDPYRKVGGVLEEVGHFMRCRGRDEMCVQLIGHFKQLHNEAIQKDQTSQ